MNWREVAVWALATVAAGAAGAGIFLLAGRVSAVDRR